MTDERHMSRLTIELEVVHDAPAQHVVDDAAIAAERALEAAGCTVWGWSTAAEPVGLAVTE